MLDWRDLPDESDPLYREPMTAAEDHLLRDLALERLADMGSVPAYEVTEQEIRNYRNRMGWQ